MIPASPEGQREEQKKNHENHLIIKILIQTYAKKLFKNRLS
jgi:hypothetical protein